jgi:hypothetical protein
MLFSDCNDQVAVGQSVQGKVTKELMAALLEQPPIWPISCISGGLGSWCGEEITGALLLA